MNRTILHVDMNNCYASIEAKMNPKLQRLPLAVCGSTKKRHGIVLAKSQEAKIMGVKTGEAIWEAKQKCPDLVIVPPNYEAYLYHSRLARDIYYHYTNQVDPFGLDECWLDVTGSAHLFGSGYEIAQQIRRQIKEELGITVSIGVSFNKIFAKLGSDLRKPNAVTEIPETSFKDLVWPLPVEKLMGIGPATKKKLNRIGIETLGELAKTDPELLQKHLHIHGLHLWELSNGRDISEVRDRDENTEVKSIGRGITCTGDLYTNEEVHHVFQELAFDVSKSLRENNFQANGVQISVRNYKLKTVQFQGPLDLPSQTSLDLTSKAMELFISRYTWSAPIRSLTIRAIHLEPYDPRRQIDFFHNEEVIVKFERLDETIYHIRKRYGPKKATFSSMIGDIKMPQIRPEVGTLSIGTAR